MSIAALGTGKIAHRLCSEVWGGQTCLKEDTLTQLPGKLKVRTLFTWGSPDHPSFLFQQQVSLEVSPDSERRAYVKTRNLESQVKE